MNTVLRSTLFAAFFLFTTNAAFGQASACPAVDAGLDQTICGGCTNLTATVQGTVGTTAYTQAAVPYNPYSYTAGPQVLVNIDDIWTPAIAIPFCFEFYGNTYSQLVIGSNGLVSFNTALPGGYCEWQITSAMPNTTAYDNCILACYQDIDPSIGASSEVHYNTYGVAPCREFVISWYNVPMYSAGCNSMLSTNQIVLHESTNIIDIYLQDKPLCSAWNSGAGVQGIINLGGTQSMITPGRNFPTQWTATNDGQRFVPAGAPNYALSWDGPSGPLGTTNTINVCPTTTTTYTATVTNNSCAGPIIVTDVVTVTINSSLTATASSTPSACTASNGTATATPANGSGNYSYSWSPSGGTGQTATGLAPGTYTVTVTDITTGCVTTQTVVVGNNGNVSSTATQTDLTCNTTNDGSATVTVSGGTGPFTYVWTPNVSSSPTASGLTSGTYTCVVTDANGCTTSQSFIITAPTLLTASTSQTDVLCFGNNTGSATVVPAGGNPGYTYSWVPSGGTGATESSLLAGTYTVTVTDLSGCTTVQSVTITEPPQLTISTSSTPVNCLTMGTATATVGGGTGAYTYLWTPSGGTGATENNLSAGTYTVVATDANGCSLSQAVIVTQVATMTIAFTSSDATCFGGSTGTASVTPTGGSSPYTYQWSPSGGNNASATGLSAGTYTCLITDANGCTATQTVLITEPTQLSASSSGTSPLCNGGTTGSALVTVSGGTGPYIYSWAPSGGTGSTANGLGAGTFTCTITDANGCPATQIVTLTQPPAITATGTGNSVCPGSNATIIVTASGGTSPYTYSWNNGPTTISQSMVANAASQGTYTVTVTDANGCTQTATAAVTLLPVPTAAFTTDATNGVVVLTGGTGDICFSDASTGGATSWIWDFNGLGTSTLQSPCFTVTSANSGTFCTELMVQSANGCADTTEVCVEVGQSSYSIPNVFTPNEDGNNDAWIITNEGMTALHCAIFDRWGALIYEWDGTTGNWDGRTKSGKDAVDGVYYYVAELTDFTGLNYYEQGFLHLLRSN